MRNSTGALLKPNVKAAFAEFIGTFFLTLAALLGGTPYAAGLTLAAFVYAVGSISGAHLNPAVTIGLLVNRSITASTGTLYIAAQILGALLARSLGNLVGVLAPYYFAANSLAEFVGFGILMLTVLAVYEKNVPSSGSGIAIGAALTAGLLISKGILNPAVAIAMNQTLSPATWATVLSAIVFTVLFRLFVHKPQTTI
ncbi:transmembrane water channel; aquaporin Z [Rivularia sp. IAM M-261]|nr:transmembrane water channel; aquaporin Z [Calothrix sp. PCC 7716]GJD18324.1 transmembrane water channel; aquaporin Z [Rivularia sp. IAM M-261]